MSGSTVCMGATSEGLPSAEQFKRQRAHMTLPERLCFLLDVSPEMGSPWEDGQPRIEAVKAAVRMIYRRKVNLCAGHSFAVMAFDRCGRVTPLGPFSSKASDLDSALEAVRVQPQVEAVPGDAVDLSVLVDDVQTALRADPSADSAARYIHRCVIIYCRSDEVRRQRRNRYFFNICFVSSCIGSSVFVRACAAARAFFLRGHPVSAPPRQRAGGPMPICVRRAV